MKLCLVFLLIYFGCTNPEQAKREKCEPILQEILSKQKIREVARKDFQITINWYTQGKMSEEAWILERNNWLDRENELLQEVNKLYELSYKIKWLE